MLKGPPVNTDKHQRFSLCSPVVSAPDFFLNGCGEDKDEDLFCSFKWVAVQNNRRLANTGPSF